MRLHLTGNVILDVFKVDVLQNIVKRMIKIRNKIRWKKHEFKGHNE